MRLSLCHCCQFLFNSAFDANYIDYGEDYESTQSCSATFRQFHVTLASDLISRHHLKRKHIVEVGCGQGEFLNILCELGENFGLGFDPAYRRQNNEKDSGNRVQFVAELFSERHADLGQNCDVLCCKMTLEHIPNVKQFLNVIHETTLKPQPLIVFQVPNAQLILRQNAFWDIYYEHCSYFTPYSLERLFRSCGFDVLELNPIFNDQYLWLEARPVPTVSPMASNDQTQNSETPLKSCPEVMAKWRQWINMAERKKIVLWGGGSKAVAFCTNLGIGDRIRYVVDINPRKHDTFLPGGGQSVGAPEFLKEYRPDHVILMNPNYRDEVEQMLTEFDVVARVRTVVDTPVNPS